MSWTEGYVTEVEYTYGYYPELNPLMLRLATLAAGIVPPDLKELRYLDLGFGQGISINIHAAALPGEFWGTDFNPHHVAHARGLAKVAGSNATLLEKSFAELANSPELPEFDIIGIHGIWTWISHANKRAIVEIIRRKLRLGGLVYISYNCMPGWAPAMPLRHLIKLYGDRIASDASSMTARLDLAFAFAKRVVGSNAAYFRANPTLAARLEQTATQDKNYLSHEYFSDDWDIMNFSELAQWLDPAKVSFAASANFLDQMDVLNLSADAQKLLAEINEPVLRQTLRDYFVNQQFRKDIFIKGARVLPQAEKIEALRSQAFVLVVPKDRVPKKVSAISGEASLDERVYSPLVEYLASDRHAPKTLEQLAVAADLKELGVTRLLEALFVLIGMSCVAPAQVPSAAAKSRCEALNRYICDRARTNEEIIYFASPVTGSGVHSSRFEQLIVLGLREKRKTAKDLATFVIEILKGQGRKLIKNKEELPWDTAGEEIEGQARQFLETRLDIFKALGVV